jgi:hypothetical protein
MASTPLSGDPGATSSHASGVTFRETMAGAFELGLRDPKAVSADAPVLAMHAVIEIDDIAAFRADPQHKARLRGTIDYAPLGTGLVAPSGVFGLFSPSGDPKLTYMVYELAFEHAGKPHYLAGKKHVAVGAPWHLWHETTTLYTTLHQGSDASGRVIGAGTLSLGVGALLSLLGTLGATPAAPARSLWQRMGAITSFFVFFSGELMRTYVLRRPRGERS